MASGSVPPVSAPPAEVPAGANRVFDLGYGHAKLFVMQTEDDAHNRTVEIMITCQTAPTPVAMLAGSQGQYVPVGYGPVGTESVVRAMGPGKGPDKGQQQGKGKCGEGRSAVAGKFYCRKYHSITHESCSFFFSGRLVSE